MTERNDMSREIPHPRRTLRRIGAVLAGMLAGAALSLGTDGLMHAAGVFPPWGEVMSDALFLLATAYRGVYNVVASYLSAWLSPMRPMWHAMVLGAINFAVSLVGAVATWDRGPEFGPHWYPLVLVVLALPCAWAGGKLFAMRPTDRIDSQASTR